MIYYIYKAWNLRNLVWDSLLFLFTNVHCFPQASRVYIQNVRHQHPQTANST